MPRLVRASVVFRGSVVELQDRGDGGAADTALLQVEPPVSQLLVAPDEGKEGGKEGRGGRER